MAIVKKNGIVDLLIRKNIISKEALKDLPADALENPVAHSDKFGISKEDLIKIVTDATKIPYVPPDTISPSKEATKLIPEKVARQYGFIPETVDNESISIVMMDPTNIDTVNVASFVTGREVKARWSDADKIWSLINEFYNPQKTLSEIISRIIKSQADMIDYTTAKAADEIETEVEGKPIVRIVNIILSDAIKQGASDIHIEPTEQATEVRYRIDGDLHKILTLPKTIHSAIVSRIKVLAKLDIAVKRTPQDGKMRIRMGEKVIDMRVSTLPTAYGEKVVIRILDPKMTQLPLEALGFPPKVEKQFKEACSKTQGMVIVTGPTGSGKSTTLYSVLNWLKSPKVNIITVEDPIEYELKGINQVQVNPKAGLTFAATLKSILRQDPDVVLVGEIRDPETAEIAIRAALTGHLVLSTLHTNDAPSAVTRLEDMGVPRYLIASALTTVLAQRLLKRICENCKTEVSVDSLPDEQKKFAKKYGIEKVYKGKGCEKCRFTGYKGRIGIFELFAVDHEISEMIIKGATDIELKRFAVENKGMMTLFMDALEKVKQGITTIDEMKRVVGLRDPLEVERKLEKIEGKVLEKGAAERPLIPEKELTMPPVQPETPITTAPTKQSPFAWSEELERERVKRQFFGENYARISYPSGAAMRERVYAPSKNTVLIIDDDPLIRRMVRALLEGEGFTVYEAENGAQGLEMAARIRPGLIILDVMMPVLNGYEVLKALRSRLEFVDIPVLMLTAESDQKSELYALELGADDYIRKPFVPQLLVARVKALLRRVAMRV